MKKLLIATHNPAKFSYFKELLQDFSLDLKSLHDLQIKKTPVEDGKDELENALIKARYYSHLSGLLSFSDDVGLYIEALNNAPGVKVRRWGGRFADDVSDRAWLDYLLEQMKDVPRGKRDGCFKIARAIVSPNGQEYHFTWQREFTILEKADWSKYKPGWPMSAVYIEKKFNKSWTELSRSEQLEYEKENLEHFNNIFKNCS